MKERKFLSCTLNWTSILTLRRIFFSGERGKKERLERVVYRPLTKVSVNVCVIVMCQIVPEIQAVCSEGGYYRNDVYLPALQSSGECHVKVSV